MARLSARPNLLTGEGIFSAIAAGVTQPAPGLLAGEAIFPALAKTSDSTYGASTVINGSGIWRFGLFFGNTLPDNYTAITQAEFDTLTLAFAANGGHTYPGGEGKFFDIVGGVVTSTPDTRPLLRLAINANPIFLTVDDDFDTTIAFQVISGGVVDVTYNQELDVRFNSAKVLHMKFVKGVALVAIDRTTEESYRLETSDQFRIETALTINVYGSKVKEG